MRKMAILFLTFLLPTSVFAGAGETVKTIGDGMQIGGIASSNPLGGAVAAFGAVLSIGVDLFSSGGIPTQDAMLIKAAAKWNKPRAVVESNGLIALKQSFASDTKLTEQINTVINRVKEEATTGKFSTGHKMIYINSMFRFDRGEWITVGYPIEGSTDKALLLWCNKASDSCILSSVGEHVDLPAYNDTAKTLKAALNGSVVTLGEFDAYEPKLSSLGCGILGSVKSFYGGAPTFAGAVKNKLHKRIVDASGYAANSANVLTGKLTKLDISVLHPEWNFELELKSANGKTLTIKEQYKFEFEFWSNDVKCVQISKAFGPAVEYLAEQIVKKPEFVQLFAPLK